MPLIVQGFEPDNTSDTDSDGGTDHYRVSSIEERCELCEKYPWLGPLIVVGVFVGGFYVYKKLSK